MINTLISMMVAYTTRSSTTREVSCSVMGVTCRSPRCLARSGSVRRGDGWGAEEGNQDVQAEDEHPRREEHLDPGDDVDGEQEHHAGSESKDGEPPRSESQSSGHRGRRDGEH